MMVGAWSIGVWKMTSLTRAFSRNEAAAR